MKSGFQPKILLEDRGLVVDLNYKICEICTKNSRIIWGEGNPNARIMIVLDNPGEREDKYGNEYICGTRQTLQKVINDVGINIDEVYITYLLKCRPTIKYDKEKVREFSKPFLIKQIIDKNPSILVFLGDVVVKSMFNNNNLSVKDLRGKLNMYSNFKTIISYHPLAVRRRPNLEKLFFYDFQLLKKTFEENLVIENKIY